MHAVNRFEYNMGHPLTWFDSIGNFKSPSNIKELRSRLLRSYGKDVAVGKENSFGQLL